MSSYCKFYKEKKQVSYDNGVTYIDVTPAEYRKGGLIERDSSDCEYIPSSSKLYATYSDSTTYNVDCNSSTTLSQTEVRGHSTAYSSMTSAEIGNCVTSIDYNAFAYCSGLTSIDIPDSVTIIGNYAFQYCTSLTSCTIGSGVTTIGVVAFYNCRSLTSIGIPNSVTSIGDSAFYNCSLTSIDIPDSVTSIGSNAFGDCERLTTCTIGSGVTSIGSQTFWNCSNLTSLTVNATTPPTLGAYAFYNAIDCTIYVPCESVEAYKSASGWSDYASRIQGIPPCGDYANQYFTIEAIDNNMYIGFAPVSNQYCYYSTDSGLTWQSSSAITVYNLNAGDKVLFKGNLYPYEQYSGIGGISSNKRYKAYGNIMSLLYGDLFSNQTSLNGMVNVFNGLFATEDITDASNLILPATTLTEGCYSSMFHGCNLLTAPPKLPATTLAKQCYSQMFENCTSLTTAPDLPATTLAYACYYLMFRNCSSLNYIKCLAEDFYNTTWDTAHWVTGVASSGTFIKNCNTTWTIGESGIPSGWSVNCYVEHAKLYGVSRINEPYLVECNSSTTLSSYEVPSPGGYGLKTANIGDCVTTIAAGAFSYNGVVSVTIPNNVTTIGNYAFRNSYSLSSITIPDSVTSFGNYMFTDCSGLTSAHIGNGVTSIGEDTFELCVALTSCTIGNSVTSIGNDAFASGYSLANITIPDSVTYIGKYAFFCCSAMTYANIGSGVTKIDDAAFGYCFALTGITIPDSVTSFGTGAASFNDCSAMTSVTIGSGITNMGVSTFSNCRNLRSVTIKATTPPTLGNQYVFSNTNNCTIYVPSGSVNAYKNATGWSSYSSRIRAIS